MWSLSTLQVAWHQCAGLSAKSGVRVTGEAAKAGFDGRSKARCQAAPPLHPTRIANVANLKRACFCTVFILWQDAIPARFLGQDPLHFIGAIVAGVLSVTWSTWYLVADRHRHSPSRQGLPLPLSGPQALLQDGQAQAVFAKT